MFWRFCSRARTDFMTQLTQSSSQMCPDMHYMYIYIYAELGIENIAQEGYCIVGHLGACNGWLWLHEECTHLHHMAGSECYGFQIQGQAEAQAIRSGTVTQPSCKSVLYEAPCVGTSCTNAVTKQLHGLASTFV